VPNIEMFFRLRHDPALGLFAFVSGNWSFAEQAIMAKAALASAFHEVLVADAAGYARSPLSRENAAV